ncbi:MAG TPA: hypothetical protein VE053_01115 [Allosphingosinicella sp.]|nr:hypothetical protein [Allosphingosinicella sp.]
MMHIFCRAGHHSARPSTLCNQGIYFSTCSRCDRDMIRTRAGWKRLAPGFRVVWKPAVRRPAANLPAIYVAPVPSVAAREKRVARATAPRRRMVAAGIAVSALRLLAGFCLESLKRWQESEIKRRLARRPVLRLAGPS